MLNFLNIDYISHINALEISYDNHYIISSSLDRTVRIWNLISRKQEFFLTAHTSYINVIRITRDNNYMITVAEDKTVQIWNLITKSQKNILGRILLL